MSASLYETDFVRWSEEQAGAIRRAAGAGANLPLDWENIAEEIESLGKSQRTELANRLETIVEHLLKLDVSPAAAPRAGWKATVVRSRGRVERLLSESPSLRSRLRPILDEVQVSAARYTALDLGERGETAAAIRAQLQAGGYTVDQVLGDWFPGEEA